MPAGALDRVKAFFVELRGGAEEVGIVGHVEHGVVLDRPDFLLIPVGAVDEHGVLGVDFAGDVGVAAGAEDRGGAGVGVDAGEVVGREREAAIVIGDGFGGVQEEGAGSFVKLPLRAANDKGAELEARVHVREEGRQIGAETPVLKVE